METTKLFDFCVRLSFLGVSLEYIDFRHVNQGESESTREFYGTRDDVSLSAGNYAITWSDCDFADDLCSRFPCRKIEIDDKFKSKPSDSLAIVVFDIV